jgi:ABC-type polar amino acid transport system ATPase subunit
MIAVRELRKRFGNQEILGGISLDVRRGEVAAVMGPSGGGKSTLLRCLNGLEPFDAGAVAIGDLELRPGMHPRRDARLLQAVRRHLGFVFQQFNLFPHRTVLENLIEAPIHVLGLARDEAVARARRLLERVGLPEKEDAYPRHLSGGQQQRVAIARALAMEPEAMLFDEPTSALDPAMANEVLTVIADLARGGQTMVVVTHSTAFALGAATTVHVLAAGRTVESGPAERVLNDPHHDLTRRFLSNVVRRIERI